VLLHFEGAKPLEGSVAALRGFYRLGVRSIQPVHNLRNELGDGVSERGSGGGLTRAGEAVVREMNRLGMVVDVSHASEATFYHILRVSERPLVASHSNCSAIRAHARSLTDDQLRAMRENGGLIGVNLIADFVDGERATIDRVVDHLDHMVEFIGPDHVYLGNDFTKCDGPRSPRELRYASPEGVFVEGLEEADQLPALTEGLLRRGYAEPDVIGILGGNYIRFLQQTLPSREQA
jgi:membrane dipeptidase